MDISTSVTMFYSNPEKYIREKFAIDSEDISPVVLVAQKGDIQLINLLIDNGYDLNQMGPLVFNIRDDEWWDRFWVHPVEAAIKMGHFATAIYLHQHGSNVDDKRVKSFCPPLCRFAYTGDENIKEIKFLLEELGSDPNACNLKNRSALLEATVWGQTEACKILLDKGADPNIEEWYEKDYPGNGRTPYIAAMQKQFEKVVKVFIENGRIDYHKNLSQISDAAYNSSHEINEMVFTDMHQHGIDTHQIRCALRKKREEYLRTIKDNVHKMSLFNTLFKCYRCPKSKAHGDYAMFVWENLKNFTPCKKCGSISGMV